MALIAPAFITVNPSFIEPGLILPYAQASGAFELIDGGEPRVRLADDDLVVYMKRVDLRTQIEVGQASPNQLPGVSIALSMISTATYNFRVHAEYDHHDVAAAARWALPLPEAYRLGMEQAHNQLARNALLYGLQPQNGEGLLNASGSTSVNLPPDSNGNDTVVTYDNGQMALFLLQQLGALKVRLNQFGLATEFTICGPQRILGEQWEYAGIVQLVQYQRPGAGTETTGGLVTAQVMKNGDTIKWVYDDTLIGKGSGGTDVVMITAPTLKKPTMAGINTNIFASVEPGIDVCATMYADLAHPREIVSPLPQGGTDVLSEWRLSSGWMVRPEALTQINLQYQ